MACLQVYLAGVLLRGVTLDASVPEAGVREAAGMLGQALLARYGRVGHEGVAALAQANMEVSGDFF